MKEFCCWFIEQIDATGINFEDQLSLSLSHLSHKCKLNAERLALSTKWTHVTTEALYCNNGNKYGWTRPSYGSRYSMSVSFKWKISIGKWIVQSELVYCLYVNENCILYKYRNWIELPNMYNIMLSLLFHCSIAVKIGNIAIQLKLISNLMSFSGLFGFLFFAFFFFLLLLL